MAWNRPTEGKRPARNAERHFAITSSLAKGLVAGLIVVAGSAIAWKMLNNPTPSSPDKLTKTRRLIESKIPASSESKPSSVARKKYSEMTNEEKLQQIYDKYGENIPANLKATVYFLKNPPQKTFHPARSKNSIFKHHSERMIASLLDIEPGGFIARRPTFDERFDREFATAMADPTLITKDDNEEQQQLKRLVAESMAEIAARVQKGEKASAMMTAFVDDLYSLGKYRRGLERQLTELKMDSKYSDKDIEDFIAAANEMLRKEGAKELSAPRLFLRHLSLKKAAERKAAKENASKEQKGM